MIVLRVSGFSETLSGGVLIDLNVYTFRSEQLRMENANVLEPLINRCVLESKCSYSGIAI